MRKLDYEDGKFKEYKSCWNFDDEGNSWLENYENWEEPYIDFAPFFEFNQVERDLLETKKFQPKVNYSFNRNSSKKYYGLIVEPVEKLYWIYNSYNDLVAKVMIIQKNGEKGYLINRDRSNNNEWFYDDAKELLDFKEILNVLICENEEIIKGRMATTFSFKVKSLNGEERIIEVYLEESREFYNKSSFMRTFDLDIRLFRNSDYELTLPDLNYVQRFNLLFDYIFNIDPSIIQIELNEKIKCPLIKIRISTFRKERGTELEVIFANGKTESYEKFIEMFLFKLMRNGLVKFRMLSYYEKQGNTNLKESGIGYSVYKSARLKQIKKEIEEMDQHILKKRERGDLDETYFVDEDYFEIVLGDKKRNLLKEATIIESLVDFK